MPNLFQLFPDPKDMLALEPEELGAALMEVIPGLPNSTFTIEDMTASTVSLRPGGQGGWPHDHTGTNMLAIAEAISWLEREGLIVQAPGQPAVRYAVTRRGRRIRDRFDVEAYVRGRALPIELLQPVLVRKVRTLFVRGDYDVAVFAAFKEAEVAARKAGGYPDALVGKDLMTKAFHHKTGRRLRNRKLIDAERQAEMNLFAGAMGHAKNPPSHRDVNLSAETAARLIILASHMLDVIQQRAAERAARSKARSKNS